MFFANPTRAKVQRHAACTCRALRLSEGHQQQILRHVATPSPSAIYSSSVVFESVTHFCFLDNKTITTSMSFRQTKCATSARGVIRSCSSPCLGARSPCIHRGKRTWRDPFLFLPLLRRRLEMSPSFARRGRGASTPARRGSGASSGSGEPAHGPATPGKSACNC